jgi:hypothetical protein
VGLSNQGLLQQSIRGITSTTHVFNGDWLALFALSNITTGTWDERCLAWINVEMSASYTNLADAQHAYAVSQGFDRWSDMSGLAPNVEQDTGNQTTTAATSDTATFTNATVTGRGVIVVFALKSGRRVSTLVDNKGNTYNRVGFAVDESDAVVEMWYAQQITGGASHVITVTYDGAANCVWGAVEVSRVKGGGGLLDANSVRTTTRGGVGSSASVTVTSGTLRDRNELVVAMLSLAGGGADAGIDTPTAYTAITQFNNFDGIHAGHGAYRTAPNTQAQSATWANDTTTAPYAAIIAAFRAVGAVSVSGTAPVNTVVPAITGTTTEGETLTSSTGTWSGTVVSYTYQWKADGVNISGATASTYVLTSSEIGATVTVAVTATNEVGSTSATSAGVGPIVAAYVFSGAMVKKAADQTAANYSTAAVVSWDTEVYDTDAWHDAGTPSRFTVPSGVSYVRFTACVAVTSVNANANCFAWVFKNGDNAAATRHTNLPTAFADSDSTTQWLNLASGPYSCTPGDYFELRLETGGDSSTTVEDYSWFAVEKVG